MLLYLKTSSTFGQTEHSWPLVEWFEWNTIKIVLGYSKEWHKSQVQQYQLQAGVSRPMQGNNLASWESAGFCDLFQLLGAFLSPAL